MAVPEAAVDEDHRMVFRQDEIRPAGKLAVVHSVAEPARMQAPADNQLRLCVLAPDGRHVATAGSPVVYIRHSAGAGYLLLGRDAAGCADA